MSLSIEEVTLSNLDKVMSDIAFWFDPSMQCAPNLPNPYPPKAYIAKVINDIVPWVYAGFDSDLNMYVGLALISPNINNNLISDVRWSWIVAQPMCFIEFTLAMVNPVLEKINNSEFSWAGDHCLWAAVYREDIANLARANENIKEVFWEDDFPPLRSEKLNNDIESQYSSLYIFCLKDEI